jgi:hypothetical protein
MSGALADLMASAFFLSAAAIASKHEFFSAVVSWASSRDATLACLASRVICSFKVMWKEGKPKSQSEKGEVSSVLRNPWSFFLHKWSDKPVGLILQLLLNCCQKMGSTFRLGRGWS